jgi:CheY-like chemotaxis protein
MCFFVSRFILLNHSRLILKKKLTMSGHSVSLTVHGQEAIELFERDPSKFDIILMDLQLSLTTASSFFFLQLFSIY